VKLWCELAWLGGDEPDAGVLLTVDGDSFRKVEPGAVAPPDAERLPGLTLPGLANAHSHAFQRALRGRTHGATGSFWTWRDQMYELAETITPDSYLPLARATFAEMARAGITVVGEFHYLHAGGNAMGDAVIQAAADVGIRLTLIDACYLRGGLDSFRDTSAEAWAARVDELRDGERLRIGAAIHSVRAVDIDSMRVVAQWATGRGAPLHAHVSEQPAENEACMAENGLTPTMTLAEAGAVSPAFTAVHATHLTDNDIALLGFARVCMCPTTERDLADGIGPARLLRDASATPCPSTDPKAFIDPFEEARAIELDERLATGVRGSHSPAQLLEAATAGGYESLGWPGGGRLAAGAPADLVNISLDTVTLAGTRPQDAIAAAVFAAGPRDVRRVMVAGRWLKTEGTDTPFHPWTEESVP
jgi:formiminoglutamate deiminase